MSFWRRERWKQQQYSSELKQDDIAVPEYYHYKDIIETSPHCLHEIKCFFEDYKKMRKKVVVDAFLPTNTAYDAIQYFQ
uniref:inorganic diphosphatase n=1 Tax=Oryza meridionalis TaxID=40149 RepID=A0A0E0CZM2_9ORYZ